MLINLKPYINLARPWNVVIAFLTIIVAAALGGTSLQPLFNVFLAAISASLITIGANVINDYFDESIDRINKPQRPIPSGQVPLRHALYYFFIVYLSAWLIAAFLSVEMFVLAILVSLLLIIYSWILKRTVIWGNFVVSLSSALAFIYGGMSVERPLTAIFPAVFAFLFHFGREIIKDMQDIEGDSDQGAHTFAIKYGLDAAYRLSLAIFILLVVITIIPYILNIYSIVYMLIITCGIYPVMVFVALRCRKDRSPRSLGLVSNLLKADMIVGLIAIYFG